MKPRIAIYVKPLEKPFSGSGSHLLGLLSALQNVELKDMEIVLLSNTPISREHCFGFENLILPKRFLSKFLFLKKHKIDLLHLHPFSLTQMFFVPGPIKVSTIHGASRTYQKMDFKVIERLHGHVRNYFVFRLAHIFTVSNASMNYISNLPLVQKDNITVIPNGVTLNKSVDYNVKTSRPYVLHISNYSVRKNPIGVLTSFLLLANRIEDIDLRICGNGWRNDFVLKWIDENKLTNRIVVENFLERQDLEERLRHADVFLFPSNYEGFGMPNLEAMSLGVPVVTSPAFAVSEIVGDAAIICEPDDYHGLSDAMYKLLTDNDCRTDYIERGFARSLLFRWEDAARLTLNIYSKLVC